jgi:hypothetical protein
MTNGEIKKASPLYSKHIRTLLFVNGRDEWKLRWGNRTKMKKSIDVIHFNCFQSLAKPKEGVFAEPYKAERNIILYIRMLGGAGIA